MNKKSIVLTNAQIVKKHFSNVNREGLGFLEWNMNECIIDLDLNTLVLINESFDEVLTDLAKHNDVTEKHKTIVNAVRDLILQIVNRRLTNNGK